MNNRPNKTKKTNKYDIINDFQCIIPIKMMQEFKSFSPMAMDPGRQNGNALDD